MEEGLLYELVTIEATGSNLDFSKIYNGKVVKDRSLFPRKTSLGWNNFIDKVTRGEI